MFSSCGRHTFSTRGPSASTPKGEKHAGSVWCYGRYSIAVYTSPSGFPKYLTDLAELYVNRYPSTL